LMRCALLACCAVLCCSVRGCSLHLLSTPHIVLLAAGVSD
jgi:hypothetical protein